MHVTKAWKLQDNSVPYQEPMDQNEEVEGEAEEYNHTKKKHEQIAMPANFIAKSLTL